MPPSGESNSARRLDTAAALLEARAFKAGVTDLVKGRPFAVDSWPLAQHWFYERGRLYAEGLLAEGKCIPLLPAPGRPLRRYADAFRALDRLRREKVII